MLNQGQKIFLVLWIIITIFVCIFCFSLYGKDVIIETKRYDYYAPSHYKRVGLDAFYLPIMFFVVGGGIILFLLKEERGINENTKAKGTKR